MNRRAEILQALVRGEVTPEPLLRELHQFGWDWSGEPLIVFRRDDLLRVIDRFLSGQFTAAQLQAWAEALECREDVAFDPADESLLDDVFFRLATPFINEPLTCEVVQSMRNSLHQFAVPNHALQRTALARPSYLALPSPGLSLSLVSLGDPRHFLHMSPPHVALIRTKFRHPMGGVRSSKDR